MHVLCDQAAVSMYFLTSHFRLGVCMCLCMFVLCDRAAVSMCFFDVALPSRVCVYNYACLFCVTGLRFPWAF